MYQIKSTIKLLVFIVATAIFTSCGNTNNAKNTEEVTTEQEPATGKPEHTDETSHHAHYRCPKDCEHGKTYEQEGKCPVCNSEMETIPHAYEPDHHSHEHKDGENHNH